MRANGKTNDAGLAFLRCSVIPAFKFFFIIEKGVKEYLRTFNCYIVLNYPSSKIARADTKMIFIFSRKCLLNFIENEENLTKMLPFSQT